MSEENYEKHHSHTHCFDQEESPCGIKGKHRCCLCGMEVTIEPEWADGLKDALDWPKKINVWRADGDSRHLFQRGIDYVQTLLDSERKKWEKENVGMLRQWLNEDRITDPNKMVTNEQIIRWLSNK